MDRGLAPLVRLIVPSGATPSKVTPVAGSYTGARAALAPKYQAADTPARRRTPGRSGGVGDGQQALKPAVAPYAYLGAVPGVAVTADVRPARDQQVRVNDAAFGDGRLEQPGLPGARERRGHQAAPTCQTEREQADGISAP